MPRKQKRGGSSSRGSPASGGRRSRGSSKQNVNLLRQEFVPNRHNGFSMREEASYTGSHFGRANLRHSDQIAFVSAGWMAPDEIFKSHPPPQLHDPNDPNELVVPHTHIDNLDGDVNMEEDGREDVEEGEEDEVEEDEDELEADFQTQPSVLQTTSQTTITTTVTTTMQQPIPVTDNISQSTVARAPSPTPSDASEEICFVPRNRRTLGQTQAAPVVAAPKPVQEQVVAAPVQEPVAPLSGPVPVAKEASVPTKGSDSIVNTEKPKETAKPKLNPAAGEFKASSVEANQIGQQGPVDTEQMWDTTYYNYYYPQTHDYYSAEDYIGFNGKLQKRSRNRSRRSQRQQQEVDSEEDAMLRDYMENIRMNEEDGYEEAYNDFSRRGLALNDGMDFYIPEDDEIKPKKAQVDSYDIMTTIRGLAQQASARSQGQKNPELPKPKKPEPSEFADEEEEYVYRYDNESAESNVEGEVGEVLDRRVRNGEVQFLVSYDSMPRRRKQQKSSYWVLFEEMEGENKEKAEEFTRIRAEYGNLVDKGMKSRVQDAEEDIEVEEDEEEEDGEGSAKLIDSDEEDSDDEDDYEDVDSDEEDADALDSDEEKALQEDEDYLLAMKIAEEEAFADAADAYAGRFDDDMDVDNFDGDLLDFLSFGGPNPKTGKFPNATKLADAYDGFDVLDRARPSIMAGGKKRKNKKMPQFDISDEEIAMKLTTQWENDRQKKKARKEERTKARQNVKRAAPPAFANSKHLKYKLDNWWLDEDEIDIGAELLEFIMGDMDMLLFPPLDQYKRRLLHELGADLNLRTKSIGSGQNRAPTLRKMEKKRILSEAEIRATMAQRKFRALFKYSDVVDSVAADRLYKMRKAEMRASRGGRGSPAIHNKPGTIVGSDAPEIGSENKGRKMLEKMGYKTGMGLGANDHGIINPIEAVVRGGRAGLG